MPHTRLSALTEMLQAYPAQLRWVYADQALLRSVAHGQPLVRGGRGKWLYRLLAVADGIGCAWLLLQLLALLQLTLLQFQFSFRRGPQTVAAGSHLFVGFGAGAEDLLYRQFSAEAGGEVGRVDQTDLWSFEQLLPLGWQQHRTSLTQAFALAKQAIAELPAALAAQRLDLLRFIGIRIVGFAYYRAWFAAFKHTRLVPHSQVAFVAQDTAAFAACEQQVPSLLLQHGLVFHLVMPDFTRVKALTMDEARWLTRVLPQAEIVPPVPPKQIDVSELGDDALIASIYGSPDFLALILPFVDWARTLKLPLVIRPHPREEHHFWRGVATGPLARIDRSSESFLPLLARLKPRVVVSWYSTTLAEALQTGIIPVTVCPLDDINVADMVYPLFERALQWPRDAEKLQRVLTDDDYYRQVLAELRGTGAVP